MRTIASGDFLTALAVLFLTASALPAGATVVYVNHAATGGNNGSSWLDAYTDLQSALIPAAPGDSIWVAAGTYYPSLTGDRDATFTLVDEVALLGGFSGTETSLDQRDWAVNQTVLSGDIGVPDDASDNSYHVVVGSGTGPTAVLDGFTVTKGNADHPDSGDWRNRGAGMYNLAGSPTVANVVFSDHSSVSNGGAMFNDASSPSLTEVSFKGNTSSIYGGAIYNRSSSNPLLRCVTLSENTANRGGAMYNVASNPTLVNVVITRNTALNTQAGGMYNYMGSSPSLTNVTFYANTAVYAGGMFNNNSSPSIVNTIMWGDSASGIYDEMYNHLSAPVVSHSLIAGGLPAGCVDGGGNTIGNPLFVDGPGGDLHLSAPPSPAFDCGNNAAPHMMTVDRDGNDRIRNGTVDIGAYELQVEGAVLIASPWSVVFEEVPFGETTCDTVRLTNTGDESCTLDEVYGCGDSPFSLDTSMTAATLAPHGSTEFLVCVNPTVIGPDTCEVTIESGAWNSTATVHVTVETMTGSQEMTPFRIVSVAPNPFNPTTAVHFTLPSALPVTAAVYSVGGGLVRVLAAEEPLEAGENRLLWDGLTDDGRPAASGVYFVRVETPLGARVARAVLLK